METEQELKPEDLGSVAINPRLLLRVRGVQVLLEERGNRQDEAGQGHAGVHAPGVQAPLEPEVVPQPAGLDLHLPRQRAGQELLHFLRRVDSRTT